MVRHALKQQEAAILKNREDKFRPKHNFDKKFMNNYKHLLNS